MFFARVDAEEKKQTFDSKSKVKVWRPSEQNFGSQKDILTILMAQEQGQYCWPSGFAFDRNYQDYIFTDEKDKLFNAESKMIHLERVIKRMIDSDQSDHIFLMFGCDFSFTNANVNYAYLERVVKRWNHKYGG